MNITFVDNGGDGRSQNVSLPSGSTAGDLIRLKARGVGPNDVMIKINRRDSTWNDHLNDGDSVMLTPKNVKAAL